MGIGTQLVGKGDQHFAAPIDPKRGRYHVGSVVAAQRDGAAIPGAGQADPGGFRHAFDPHGAVAAGQQRGFQRARMGMTAVRGEAQGNRRRLVIQAGDDLCIGFRLAQGQRSGLVEQDTVDQGHALNRAAVLDHDPFAHQRAARYDLRHRHGQAQSAGTSDDQHGNRDHHRVMEASAIKHPPGKAERREGMHGGGIEPARAVGDADIDRARLLCRVHQPRNLGQRGIGSGSSDAHVDRRIQVERAGMDQRARPGRDRRAFPGQQRLVERACSVHDLAIGGKALASGNAHDHAGFKIGGGYPLQAAIGGNDAGAGCGLAEQRVHPGAGAVAHHRVERAPCQQEQDQHQDAVEIGIVPAHHRLVETEAGGQDDADRNRHVHVGPPALQHGPGRAEERHSRIGNRRNADQGGNPVEQVARGALCPGPDRDREQHHVHAGKGRHAERREQRLYRRGRPGQFFGARLAGKADRFQRGDQVSRFHLSAVLGADLLGCQVDAGIADPRNGGQRALDLGHAPGAVHSGHDQHRRFARRLQRDRRIRVHRTSCSVRQRCAPAVASSRTRQRPAGMAASDRNEPSAWRVKARALSRSCPSG